MRICLESTGKIVQFSVQRGQRPYEARVWQGHTESGIAIQVLIPRIAVLETENQAQFEKELNECHAPTNMEPQAFPMRMLI
jgi:hypothetical protein